MAYARYGNGDKDFHERNFELPLQFTVLLSTTDAGTLWTFNVGGNDNDHPQERETGDSSAEVAVCSQESGKVVIPTGRNHDTGSVVCFLVLYGNLGEGQCCGSAFFASIILIRILDPDKLHMHVDSRGKKDM